MLSYMENHVSLLCFVFSNGKRKNGKSPFQLRYIYINIAGGSITTEAHTSVCEPLCADQCAVPEQLHEEMRAEAHGLRQETGES